MFWDSATRLCRVSLPHKEIALVYKAEKSCSDTQLRQSAATAPEQIADRQYETGMQSMGIHTIIKYGIAFSGKRVRIARSP